MNSGYRSRHGGPYQRSEPRYKKIKFERMSSPPITRPLRYALEHNPKPEVDTEQIVKVLEKRLDNKLTERLLERLEAEFEELQQKFHPEKAETGSENSVEKIALDGDMIKEKVEVSGSESTDEEKIEDAEEMDRTEAQSENEAETESSDDAEVSEEQRENESTVEIESVEEVEGETLVEAESELALEPMLYETEPEPLDGEPF